MEPGIVSRWKNTSKTHTAIQASSGDEVSLHISSLRTWVLFQTWYVRVPVVYGHLCLLQNGWPKVNSETIQALR